jgi:hypothetical protein
MQYRGVEYTVVQGIKRGVWKWSAAVAGATRSEQESSRSAAMAAAEKAIDRALAPKIRRNLPWKTGKNIS